MKTNHRRGYVEPQRKPPGGNEYSAEAPLSGQRIGVRGNFDEPNGGPKKYVRSRTRFHENAALRKIAKDL